MSEPGSTRPPNFYARLERAEICADFDRLGPDAPTLCKGWLTRDLAAHLVIREGRIDASVGIQVKALAGYTARVQNKKAALPWPQLVDKLRNGPPPWSAFRRAKLDGEVNTVELFVHHEDVLRAQPGWTPRVLDPGLTAELTSRLERTGKFTLRKVPLAVSVALPDVAQMRLTTAGPAVTIAGNVEDVLMEIFGRTNDRVTVTGEPAAVAAWRTRNGT